MSASSQVFELLRPALQKWIYDQGWTELRDAQEHAIPLILNGADVVIAAATATGKTEAAFLPICSRLLGDDRKTSVVLYISPLKALINDQTGRMQRLCEALPIEIHPWHGDVVQSRKREFIKQPTGILLITPESLESLFVNRGTSIPSIFAELDYVVIDELHSFIGTERGRQLQSLLRRLEYAIRRAVPRIGLSATLGDMKTAAYFLRPGEHGQVHTVASGAGGQELKLLVRGYESPGLSAATADEAGSASGCPAAHAIAGDLFHALRGDSHLVFANSRKCVEAFADLLRQMCEQNGVPNEFWAHHGNLSKDLREEAEAAIKDKIRSATAIATSTLELGIDLGTVTSIAQIGPPPSVSSLRQRLGRSGRRGAPAILRVYIAEPAIGPDAHVEDCLRFHLLETVSMIDLLLEKWCEPPNTTRLHLSTLVQQLLSLIAQYGGISAQRAWAILSPVFTCEISIFVSILRGLGSRQIITQEADGTLLLGATGERIVNDHSFYAVFVTPEEYRIVSGPKTLGTLPVSRPLQENSAIIFGGRRWCVIGIDEARRIIEVRPATGGRPPDFTGEEAEIHDGVRDRMRSFYASDSVPAYLDPMARKLLSEARYEFGRYDLKNRRILSSGSETVFFTWRGDRVNHTVQLLLSRVGLTAYPSGPCLRVSEAADKTLTALRRIVSSSPPSPEVLASVTKNKHTEKYDGTLDESLLNLEFAARKLDLQGAYATLQAIVDGPIAGLV